MDDLRQEELLTPDEEVLVDILADIFLESYLRPATVQTDSTVE